MILDLINGTLSFNVNNINQGIAYKNITKNNNIKYRMAVYTYHTGDSMTLINYSKQYKK